MSACPKCIRGHLVEYESPSGRYSSCICNLCGFDYDEWVREESKRREEQEAFLEEYPAEFII